MLWWLNNCTDKMTKQSPCEGHIHWRSAFSSSSVRHSRTEVQGTLYHPHLIRNSSGLGDFYLFFICTLEDISWLYPSKLRKSLLEGQGPSMLSESKQNTTWTQDIEEVAGPLGSWKEGDKGPGVLFPPPSSQHDTFALLVLNQSDSDYLEIDMSAGRWCGLRSRH